MAANELVIASLPGRSGLYLGVQENGVWRSIARFSRGEESAREFVAWAQKAGVRYDEGEAGGLLRENAEEAR